jgi:hypothetical protein
MTQFKKLDALIDPEKPWREVWSDGKQHVKLHVVQRERAPLDPIIVDVTGSACAADGSALVIDGLLALLPYEQRDGLQLHFDEDTDALAALDAVKHRVIASVVRAMKARAMMDQLGGIKPQPAPPATADGFFSAPPDLPPPPSAPPNVVVLEDDAEARRAQLEAMLAELPAIPPTAPDDAPDVSPT